MDFLTLFPFLMVLLCVLYLIIHLIVLNGLSYLHAGTSAGFPEFSIIIAARDEEESIDRTLGALLHQDYPSNRYEVVLVNDRSTDKTAEIAREYEKRFDHVRVFDIDRIASDMPPKKNALRYGIGKSRFNILAFTDADCVVPSGWLKNLALHFQPEIGVVAGYTPFEEKSPKTYPQRFSDRFLRYERLKATAGAAAAMALGKAYMASGGNFAYRKEVFGEINGFERLKDSISGDDDLFVQAVAHHTNWKMVYMTSPESHVRIQQPKSFSDFINQRKRHFSASKHYTALMKGVFFSIHFFHVLLIIGFFVSLPLTFTLCGVKLLVDYLLVHKATRIFGDASLIWQLPVLEIAYVLYHLVIAPLGLFGRFTWKEHTT